LVFLWRRPSPPSKKKLPKTVMWHKGDVIVNKGRRWRWGGRCIEPVALARSGIELGSWTVGTATYHAHLPLINIAAFNLMTASPPPPATRHALLSGRRY
jgi:hypothetical protein